MWLTCHLSDCELRKNGCAPRFVFSGEDKEGQQIEGRCGGDH